MKATRIAVLLAFAMTTIAAAQDAMPTVAEEMAKLDVLVGNWEGTGVVRMTADAPEMPWTSVSTAKKVLGGHFIMDNVKIVSEAMPVPLIFQSIQGWDQARERYVAYEMSNGGGLVESTPHFVDNKIISSATMVEDGAVVTDQWVTVIGEDEVSFEGRRSVNGGPAFVHVEGTMTRGGPGYSVGPETVAYAMAPPSEYMKPLNVMAGTWIFNGDWRPAVGVEAMPVSGRETSDSILGGHVLRRHMRGEGGGINYEAISFIGWSPILNCIVSVGCNNLGAIHPSECEMDGDRLVIIAAGPSEAGPTVTRGVMDLTENRLSWVGHSATGTGEPYVNFEGTWTREKK